MSETVKVNKSKMVREYLAQNEGAAASAVVEHFKSEGIDINKQFVYQTRTHMKNPKSKKKQSSKTSNSSKRKNASKQSVSHYDSLVIAKKLLESVNGDFAAAKKSLETLAKIIS